MKRLWVLGAGGHARVVIDIARRVGVFDVCGVLDDNAGAGMLDVAGVPLVGPINSGSFPEHDVNLAVVAIGDGRVRQRIAQTVAKGVAWVQLTDPNSHVSDSAEIGDGTVICAGAIVQPDATIGCHAILNTACSVDHDCVLEDFTQVGPGAHLGGNVTVRTGGFVGIGAAILPGIEIGEWAVVGAGAVVTRHVPPHTTVVGVPARVLGSMREP